MAVLRQQLRLFGKAALCNQSARRQLVSEAGVTRMRTNRKGSQSEGGGRLSLHFTCAAGDKQGPLQGPAEGQAVPAEDQRPRTAEEAAIAPETEAVLVLCGGKTQIVHNIRKSNWLQEPFFLFFLFKSARPNLKAWRCVKYAILDVA